jgi:beta-xylosidase
LQRVQSYKRNGYYYLIIPEGGVGAGYETALRAKNIYGPYERKVVLEQGKTNINGPHQGGLVKLLSGEFWFIHFQDAGAIGRITHLEPVKWVNDWPLIGIDNDYNGIGEPVSIWPKPKVKAPNVITAPQTSDEFNNSKLSLQWQWNHNADDSKWSLTNFKGYLSLTAINAFDNKNARNTITQKLMGNYGIFTTLLKVNQMVNGQKAGLCLLGQNIQEIGIFKTDTTLQLFANNNGKTFSGALLHQDHIFLRVIVNIKNNHTVLQYSLNGQIFKQLGDECILSNFNYWKAVRPGLFSYNVRQGLGTALFDWFHYQYDGPLGGL